MSEYHKSPYTGAQIDQAVGTVLENDIVTLAAEAKDAALRAEEAATRAENATPEVETDATLTVEGAAADAKAVGDALNERVKTINGEAPDENGNVEITVSGGGTITEEDKTEIKEAVLAELDPTVTAISAVLSGTTMTFTETLEDGSTDTIEVTLDDNGVPTGMTVNGTAVGVTMEGF